MTETILNKVNSLKALGGTKIKAYKPEIFLGFGLAMVGIGIVEACKATIKAEDVIEPAIADVEDINDDIDAQIITKEEGNKELAKVYIHTAGKMFFTYKAAIFFISIGAAFILHSHGLIREDLMHTIAAANALNESFNGYRKNVIDELGEDADKRFKYGLRKENQIEESYLNEEGDEQTKKVKNALVANPYSQHSPYSRFFDSTSDCWSPSAEYNKTFVLAQEASANDKLRTRGWLSLAEVYEMLGFEATEASLVVGWVLGNGEDKVKFDVFDVYNEATRRFVNGMEPVILLDFNVDGVIIDKLRNIGLSQI